MEQKGFIETWQTEDKKDSSMLGIVIILGFCWAVTGLAGHMYLTGDNDILWIEGIIPISERVLFWSTVIGSSAITVAITVELIRAEMKSRGRTLREFFVYSEERTPEAVMQVVNEEVASGKLLVEADLGSPESAGKIALTPSYLLLRHDDWIGATPKDDVYWIAAWHKGNRTTYYVFSTLGVSRLWGEKTTKERTDALMRQIEAHIPNVFGAYTEKDIKKFEKMFEKGSAKFVEFYQRAKEGF